MGRCVVHVDIRILLEKIANSLCLVGRKIVGDHVNLLSLRLMGNQFFEEGDRLCAGVAAHCLAAHRTCLHIQRGEQRQRTVALVLESMAFRARSLRADLRPRNRSQFRDCQDLTTKIPQERTPRSAARALPPAGRVERGLATRGVFAFQGVRGDFK